LDLNVVYATLNFYINKITGQYFPPADLDRIVNVAQMSVFNDFFIRFLTSQRIDDALAPFYRQFVFTPGTSPGGLITAPSDYYHAVSMQAIIQDADGNTKNRGITKINSDELPGVMNSQIVPPTLFDPYWLTVEDWNIQLYPAQGQAGILFYIAKPAAPIYAYTTLTRGITYNQLASTQLEWADGQILTIIMKALSAFGANTREQDVVAYAESKQQQDAATPEKL
jgi:hypothetical protein